MAKHGLPGLFVLLLGIVTLCQGQLYHYKTVNGVIKLDPSQADHGIKAREAREVGKLINPNFIPLKKRDAKRHTPWEVGPGGSPPWEGHDEPDKDHDAKRHAPWEVGPGGSPPWEGHDEPDKDHDVKRHAPWEVGPGGSPPWEGHDEPDKDHDAKRHAPWEVGPGGSPPWEGHDEPDKDLDIKKRNAITIPVNTRRRRSAVAKKRFLDFMKEEKENNKDLRRDARHALSERMTLRDLKRFIKSVSHSHRDIHLYRRKK